MENLGPARSNAFLEALRAKRPTAYRTMTDLCSCALSECRAFQALVHNGSIRYSADYEEYISPPFACKRDDSEDLYTELVHEAISREISSETCAVDLGVDEDMENGMTVTMETVTGNTLILEVFIEEQDDVDEQLMKIACETAHDINYVDGDDPGDGTFCFLCCRCVVSAKKGTRGACSDDDEEEEEAESTCDEWIPDDDDEDEGSDPVSPEEYETRNRSRKRARRATQ
jgi:hypothetical protein